MKLNRDEKAFLEALSEDEGSYPAEIERETGFSQGKISSLMVSLLEKGLIEHTEDQTTTYRITEEGRNYVEEGLPEMRLLRDILDQPDQREDMSSVASFPESNIAINWVKKKGWASIENRELVATDKGKKAIEEKQTDAAILSELKEGEKTTKELLDELRFAGESEVKDTLERLEKRGSVSVSTGGFESATQLRLSPKGVQALSEAEVVEKADRLTHGMLVDGSWRDVEFRSYDVEAEAPDLFPGKRHPYGKLLDRMRRVFVSMGFREIKSPTVESSFWNFDALFQPQDHPAREMQDTFYLSEPEELELPPGDLVEEVKQVHEDGGSTGSTGWGGGWSEEKARKAVLRTHTTAATIRHLYDNPEPPVKVFCIDRAYRRETIDATHLPQFYQLEGIVMDEGVSFKNLLGCLETFYREMGFEDVRFRPAYFPYTEPSVEPEVHVEELGEWVELGGAGIFREEVTRPAGVQHPVLAWGLGVGRLAMLRLGLNDLRDLYISDVDWLRGEPLCR